MNKSPMRIEQYGTTPVLKRISQAFKKRDGYVPAGWDATQRWKRQNSWIFN